MTQQKKQSKELQKREKEVKGIDILTKRELAKVGMSLSLATLVWTSFTLNSRSSKTARAAHIISGAALVGLSFYHNSLYDRTDKKNLLKSRIDKKD